MERAAETGAMRLDPLFEISLSEDDGKASSNARCCEPLRVALTTEGHAAYQSFKEASHGAACCVAARTILRESLPTYALMEEDTARDGTHQEGETDVSLRRTEDKLRLCLDVLSSVTLSLDKTANALLAVPAGDSASAMAHLCVTISGIISIRERFLLVRIGRDTSAAADYTERSEPVIKEDMQRFVLGLLPKRVSPSESHCRLTTSHDPSRDGGGTSCSSSSPPFPDESDASFGDFVAARVSEVYAWLLDRGEALMSSTATTKRYNDGDGGPSTSIDVSKIATSELRALMRVWRLLEPLLMHVGEEITIGSGDEEDASTTEATKESGTLSSEGRGRRSKRSEATIFWSRIRAAIISKAERAITAAWASGAGEADIGYDRARGDDGAVTDLGLERIDRLFRLCSHTISSLRCSLSDNGVGGDDDAEAFQSEMRDVFMQASVLALQHGCEEVARTLCGMLCCEDPTLGLRFLAMCPSDWSLLLHAASPHPSAVSSLASGRYDCGIGERIDSFDQPSAHSTSVIRAYLSSARTAADTNAAFVEDYSRLCAIIEQTEKSTTSSFSGYAISGTAFRREYCNDHGPMRHERDYGDVADDADSVHLSPSGHATLRVLSRLCPQNASHARDQQSQSVAAAAACGMRLTMRHVLCVSRVFSNFVGRQIVKINNGVSLQQAVILHSDGLRVADALDDIAARMRHTVSMLHQSYCPCVVPLGLCQELIESLTRIIDALRSETLTTLSQRIIENVKGVVRTLFPATSSSSSSSSCSRNRGSRGSRGSRSTVHYEADMAISGEVAEMELVSVNLLSPIMATLRRTDIRTAKDLLPKTVIFVLNRLLYELLWSKGSFLAATRLKDANASASASASASFFVSAVFEQMSELESSVDPLYVQPTTTRAFNKRDAFAEARPSPSGDEKEIAISGIVRPIFNHTYTVVSSMLIESKDQNGDVPGQQQQLRPRASMRRKSMLEIQSLLWSDELIQSSVAIPS